MCITLQKEKKKQRFKFHDNKSVKILPKNLNKTILK